MSQSAKVVPLTITNPTPIHARISSGTPTMCNVAVLTTRRCLPICAVRPGDAAPPMGTGDKSCGKVGIAAAVASIAEQELAVPGFQLTARVFLPSKLGGAARCPAANGVCGARLAKKTRTRARRREKGEFRLVRLILIQHQYFSVRILQQHKHHRISYRNL
jgi:hypothetical protein